MPARPTPGSAVHDSTAKPPPPPPGGPASGLAARQPPPPPPPKVVHLSANIPPEPLAPPLVFAVAEAAAGAAAAVVATPPAVAGVVCSYQELEELEHRMETDLTPRQRPKLMNDGLKSFRDEAQGLDSTRWHDPPITEVNLTEVDRTRIGVIIKEEASPNYKFVRDADNAMVKQTDFSVRKMLAHEHVREKLLKGPTGAKLGYTYIGVQVIDLGKSYDHPRTAACQKYGPTKGTFWYAKDGPPLPVW